MLYYKYDCETLNDGKYNKINNKQKCRNPKNWMNTFSLAFDELNEAVENETSCNTVRDTVDKGHKDPCKESWNGFF